jgi:hypothetical protein
MCELLLEKTRGWYAYIHGAFVDMREYDKVVSLARAAIPSIGEDVRLKRVDYCFLPLTVCTGSKRSEEKCWKRVGDACKFVVNAVTYNKSAGYVVLHVKMKTNYTCCVSPHIVAMTRTEQDYRTMSSWQYYVPSVSDTTVHIRPTYISATIATLCDKQPPAMLSSPKPRPRPQPQPSTTTPTKTQPQITAGYGPDEDDEEVVGTLGGKPVFMGKLGGRYVLRPSGRKRYLKQDERLDGT